MVNINAIVFSAVSFVMNICVIMMIKRLSLSTVLRIGSAIQFTGILLRSLTLFTDSFWPIIAGAFICSLSTSMFYSSVNLLPTIWFSDQQRNTATACLSASPSIGILIALLLTFTNFNDDSVDTKGDNRRLIFIQAMIGVVTFLLNLVFMREKPPKPPSAAAEAPLSPSELGQLFKEIKVNKSFGMLLITKLINFGTNISVIATIGGLLGPFGFESS